VAPDDASSGGRQIGCFDLRAQQVVDTRVPAGSAVVAFTFGNRCDREARIALQNVRASTRYPDGRSEQLVLYDPASEVDTSTLDPLDQGREVLQFNSITRRRDALGPLCIDVSGIAVDTPPAHIAAVCVDAPRTPVSEYDVIGHNSARPFGLGWNLFGFYSFAELGGYARTVDLEQGNYHGVPSDKETYQFSGATLGRSVSYGIDIRLSARITGPLYAGIVLAVGGGHVAPRPPQPAGSTSVPLGHSFSEAMAGGLVGVMAPRFHGVRLRGEIAGGLRLFDIDVDPAHCVPGYVCAAIYARALVEPRVALDAWFNPWWSTSTWIAVDALHPDASVGLSFAFHLRGFDGAP
jgi:hypothetical protein